MSVIVQRNVGYGVCSLVFVQNQGRQVGVRSMAGKSKVKSQASRVGKCADVELDA